MRIFILSLLAVVLTAASLNDARKANEAYNNGEYEKAASLYRQAIEQNPDDARLYFNLGNSLYKLGRAEEAKEAFERYKNLTETREDRSLADYNMGRMMIDNEQYDEATSYFREALKNNPSDPDARHNYELALKQLQEQEQQQQQEQQAGDSDEQDQDGEQQPQDEQQDGNPDQNPGDQPQPQPQDQQGNEEQQPQPQNISPEEAENILEALAQLERELLENQKKEATETPSNNEKDW